MWLQPASPASTREPPGWGCHSNSGYWGMVMVTMTTATCSEHRYQLLQPQVRYLPSSLPLPPPSSQSACFYCTTEGCEGGRSEHRYIRLHVAGTTESSTIRWAISSHPSPLTSHPSPVNHHAHLIHSHRNDFSCHVCGSALVEDVSFRTLASASPTPLLHFMAG